MKSLLITLILLSTSAFASSTTDRIESAIQSHFGDVISVDVSRDWLQDTIPGILYPFTYFDGETHYKATLELRTKNIKCEIRAFLNESEIILYCEGNKNFNGKISNI